MMCPVCMHDKVKVVRTFSGVTTQRIRHCGECQTVFTTDEKPLPIQADLFKNVDYIVRHYDKDAGGDDD